MPRPCEIFARIIAHQIITDALASNARLASDSDACVPNNRCTTLAPRFEGILSERNADILLQEAEEIYLASCGGME